MAGNNLIHETSPYLLQHADNPVDWYGWNDEALKKAKDENKPIFLSIGYSACHWCHVMAHESFENNDVAEFMNEHFVNIKVDREERPDIDDIYQKVCQIATGQGGWPLSIFLIIFCAIDSPRVREATGGRSKVREPLTLRLPTWRHSPRVPPRETPRQKFRWSTCSETTPASGRPSTSKSGRCWTRATLSAHPSCSSSRRTLRGTAARRTRSGSTRAPTR